MGKDKSRIVKKLGQDKTLRELNELNKDVGEDQDAVNKAQQEAIQRRLDSDNQ